MLRFYITREDRDQAQKAASELDVNHSDPPGQSPYVWMSGIGNVCIDYWYDYGSAEAKVGTLCFRSTSQGSDRSSQMVECTTEITHRPPGPEGKPVGARITDVKEHENLVECFFRELLGRASESPEVAVSQDITALKQRIEELDAVNHVATILHSAHDLQRVLEMAIERIGAALHAEAGSLLLRDDATEELVFEVAVGFGADRIRGRRLAPGQGIAGWVAKSGEAVVAPDVSADPRFSDMADRATGFVTHSVLCAPLVTSQGIIGVVQLLNRVDGYPFSRADLQLLETIALHAAAVIERAKLYEGMIHRNLGLRALLETSLDFCSTFELDPLLQKIVQKTLEVVVPASRAGIILLDEQCQYGYVKSGFADGCMLKVEPRLDLARYPEIKKVIESRQPVIISDALTDPLMEGVRGYIEPVDLRSLLVVPLVRKGQVIGVLSVGQFHEARRFSAEEVNLCQTLAYHASVAIETVRLMTELREANEAIKDRGSRPRSAKTSTRSIPLEKP